jgi:Zn-dependent protease
VPLAVGLVIASVAVCTGALASALLLSVPAFERGRHTRPVVPALRRGIEVTAVVGLLLLLRVVDGLTVITGGFIVIGFLVAEIILSARPSRASR